MTPEKLLERLICDQEFCDRYLANPDQYLTQEGFSDDDKAGLLRINIDMLRKGAYADQRRSPSLLDANVLGGIDM